MTETNKCYKLEPFFFPSERHFLTIHQHIIGWGSGISDSRCVQLSKTYVLATSSENSFISLNIMVPGNPQTLLWMNCREGKPFPLPFEFCQWSLQIKLTKDRLKEENRHNVFNAIILCAWELHKKEFGKKKKESIRLRVIYPISTKGNMVEKWPKKRQFGLLGVEICRKITIWGNNVR